jgi:hypothetical protein
MMLVGSLIRFSLKWTTIWIWLIGHVLCAGSQAFLKNPVTKLASNWFGDKEVIQKFANHMYSEVWQPQWEYCLDPRASS